MASDSCFDIGPPWAKITPARWGFFVTHGTAPLSQTETGFGVPKRWWRRTLAGAERKAQRLIDQATANRVDHGWEYRSTAPTKHSADLYHENYKVLPTCQCGWEGTWLSTYDEAADAYAEHRIDAERAEGARSDDDV